MSEYPERIWAVVDRQTHSTMWWPDDEGGVGVEYVRADRIKELEAERDVAYETAVIKAAAQAMKWLDDPDDDASLSGYILSLIGEDDE